MFAIIEDGGRQYRVHPGDKLEIDFRADLRDGDGVRFDRILAAGTESEGKIGQPVISGAVVEAEVVDEEVRGPKLEVGKFRRRKGYIRHNGHIQRYTAVRVTVIEVPGFETAKAPPLPVKTPWPGPAGESAAQPATGESAPAVTEASAASAMPAVSAPDSSAPEAAAPPAPANTPDVGESSAAS